MSASKLALTDAALCEEVVRLYLSLEHTAESIASQKNLTYHTVSAILRRNLSETERKRLRGHYHSKSKKGAKNPRYGVRTAAERIMRGGRPAVWNGSGYTFEHRIVAAAMLGLTELPADMEVHHIDGNKLNNSPDNLAICSKRGHAYLHRQFLGKLHAWEKETFGTSVLQEMLVMLQEE